VNKQQIKYTISILIHIVVASSAHYAVTPTAILLSNILIGMLTGGVCFTLITFITAYLFVGRITKLADKIKVKKVLKNTMKLRVERADSPGLKLAYILVVCGALIVAAINHFIFMLVVYSVMLAIALLIDSYGALLINKMKDVTGQ